MARVPSPPQSQSQAIVFVSTPKMYMRSGCFLVTYDSLRYKDHIFRLMRSAKIGRASLEKEDDTWNIFWWGALMRRSYITWHKTASCNQCTFARSSSTYQLNIQHDVIAWSEKGLASGCYSAPPPFNITKSKPSCVATSHASLTVLPRLIRW